MPNPVQELNQKPDPQANEASDTFKLSQQKREWMKEGEEIKQKENMRMCV